MQDIDGHIAFFSPSCRKLKYKYNSFWLRHCHLVFNKHTVPFLLTLLYPKLRKYMLWCKMCIVEGQHRVSNKNRASPNLNWSKCFGHLLQFYFPIVNVNKWLLAFKNTFLVAWNNNQPLYFQLVKPLTLNRQGVHFTLYRWYTLHFKGIQRNNDCGMVVAVCANDTCYQLFDIQDTLARKS